MTGVQTCALPISDYEADMMNLEQGQNYPSGEYGKLGGADNDEEENNG